MSSLKTLKTLSFGVIILLTSLHSIAASRYWVGTGSNKNWNTTANWAATSGGSSGASVPGATDDVYFTSGSLGELILDVNINVRTFAINSGYTANISQNGKTITVGAGGMILNDGTFTGNAGNITVNGVFTLAGTNFTSTAGNLQISGNYTKSSGSFSANNGTVTFTGSVNMTGSTDFYNVVFLSATSGTTINVDAASVFNVSHSLTTSGSTMISINTGTLNVLGDVTLQNTYAGGGGTGTIHINGGSDQILMGNTAKATGIMCSIVINKLTGTLILKNTISVSGNWTQQQGNVDASSNQSIVAFVSGTRTISGNPVFYNLSFYASTAETNNIPVNDTITITGNLTFETPLTAGTAVNGGTLKALGNITISNSGFSGSTGNLLIAGNADQLLTGATGKLTGYLGNVIINKPSGTLILKKYINSWGNWTHINGNIDGQTYESTPTAVVFNYTSPTGKTITGSHSLYHVCFIASNAATIINIATPTTLTVNGDLLFEGAYNLTINGGNIDANKDVIVENTGETAGNATINFKNSLNQTLTGNNLIGCGPLCHVNINKPSGILTVKNKITFGKNWTHINGTLDLVTHAPTIVFMGAGTITANQDFYNLSFHTGNFEIPLAKPITVTNLLKMENAGTININTGIINVTGNITTINVMTGNGGGTGLININGTTNQLFTGNNVAATGYFCNITINKPAGVLTLANAISLNSSSTWRYLQGSVDPGLSTVSCMNGSTVNPGSVSSFMQFYNFYISNGSNTSFCNLTGPLYVRNDLIVQQARTLTTNNNDITVGRHFSSVGVLNAGTSTFTFNGNGRQVVSTGYNLYKVKVDKPAGKIYLDYYNLNIVNTLSLIKGVIVSTTSTSVVRLFNTTVVGGSNQSYIAGPLTKVGNTAFTFPLGDTTLADTSAYHPFSITAPAATTDSYTAQYFAKNQLVSHPTFTAIQSALKGISTCEHWALTRNVGSSVVLPTVSWNKNSCNISILAELRVAGWDGSQWKNMGQASLTGDSLEGSITAVSPGINTASQYYTTGNVPHTLVFDTRGLDSLLLSDTLRFTVSGAGLTGTYVAGSLQNLYPTLPTTGTISTITITFTTKSNQSLVIEMDLTPAGEVKNPRVIPIGPAEPPCSAGCLDLGTAIKINECFLKNCFKLSSTVYAILKRELDGGYFKITNGDFRFKFEEEYNDSDGKLTYRLYNNKHELLLISTSLAPQHQYNSGYGTRYFAISIQGCYNNAPLAADYYTIEVENEKKEVWVARVKNTLQGPQPACQSQIPGGGIGQ